MRLAEKRLTQVGLRAVEILTAHDQGKSLGGLNPRSVRQQNCMEKITLSRS
jgi:hypothetical protein